jgi:hypothetical protein
MADFSLPQDHIDAIVAEVEATQRAAEDRAMAEKMAGTRCQECDGPIPGEPPGRGMRKCAECASWTPVVAAHG